MTEFRPGQEVVITLGAKETYIGKIAFITPSYMELVEAIHPKTSTTVYLKCYKSDITSIELLKPKTIVNEAALFCDCTLQEFVEFTQMLRNYTLIQRFDMYVTKSFFFTFVCTSNKLKNLIRQKISWCNCRYWVRIICRILHSWYRKRTIFRRFTYCHQYIKINLFVRYRFTRTNWESAEEYNGS